MRTKILLLTAALGLAGVASSMAQPVYSVNAVGYVNYTLRPGWNLISNPLNSGAGSVNDTLIEIFPPNTPIPENTTVATWDNVNGVPETENPAFFPGAQWFPEGRAIKPGEAFYIYIPDNNSYNVTFVGEVREGTGAQQLTTPITPGNGSTPGPWQFLGSQVPQAGQVSADLGLVAAEGDVAQTWNKLNGTFDSVAYSYDGGVWNDGNQAIEPTIGVADGFILYRVQTGPTAWTRSFDPTP